MGISSLCRPLLRAGRGRSAVPSSVPAAASAEGGHPGGLAAPSPPLKIAVDGKSLPGPALLSPARSAASRRGQRCPGRAAGRADLPRARPRRAPPAPPRLSAAASRARPARPRSPRGAPALAARSRGRRGRCDPAAPTARRRRPAAPHLSRPPPLLVLPGPARLLPHAAILETLASQMSPPAARGRAAMPDGRCSAWGRRRPLLGVGLSPRKDYKPHSASRRRTAAGGSGACSPLDGGGGARWAPRWDPGERPGYSPVTDSGAAPRVSARPGPAARDPPACGRSAAASPGLPRGPAVRGCGCSGWAPLSIAS